ncbi:MAG: EcsC family protein [Lachnospiraceae bacterium]|nr:EcsC family protein [Lachnospiraceae bacterium]
MWNNQTPLEKEWSKANKQEKNYLQKRMEKKDSKLNQLLEKKVPEGLQKTLDGAFAKAFQVVFENGTGIIEKTYKKEQLKKNYQVNEYAAQMMDNGKSLKAFSKKASGAGNVNLLLSGVSGIGLGVLGIGMPDIVLFTGLMLKSIYEIALNYGFDYQSEEEKQFILLLVQGALSYGEELQDINKELNCFIATGKFTKQVHLEDSINVAAGCLSKELLYMKFLQGIPIVGAAGGACDVIYMKQVVKYAELKYRRRFYWKRMKTKR